MDPQTAPLPAAALDLKETALAAAKLATAGLGDLKADAKTESAAYSRLSSVDSFDTLLSPLSTSPPSTPGRSDDNLPVRLSGPQAKLSLFTRLNMRARGTVAAPVACGYPVS